MKIKAAYSDEREMSFMEHLHELRQRLIKVVVVVLAAAVVCFTFSTALFNLFADPFAEYFTLGSLIGTGPAEAFILRLKLAFFAGIVLTIPYTLYHLWSFVSPALHTDERKLLLPVVGGTSFLFVFGVIFAYHLVLPLVLSFFSGQYQVLGIAPTIKISEYLSITLRLLLAFAVVFQMPVISLILARLGLLTSEKMIAAWQYVVISIFIISAFLTPPDIFSQLLLSGPMIVLYLLSYYLVKRFYE